MRCLLRAYLPILIFLGIAVVIGAGADPGGSFLIAASKPDPEKLSPYECGFDAFDDARMHFDVRFYLVAILFIIFDLEVAFLFPWAVAFGDIGLLRLLVDDGVPRPCSPSASSTSGGRERWNGSSRDRSSSP